MHQSASILGQADVARASLAGCLTGVVDITRIKFEAPTAVPWQYTTPPKFKFVPGPWKAAVSNITIAREELPGTHLWFLARNDNLRTAGWGSDERRAKPWGQAWEKILGQMRIRGPPIDEGGLPQAGHGEEQQSLARHR